MIVKPEGYETWRTVSELGTFVGKSTRTIERWYKAGLLPAPAVVGPLNMKLWSPQACDSVLATVISQLPSEIARSRRITRLSE